MHCKSSPFPRTSPGNPLIQTGTRVARLWIDEEKSPQYTGVPAARPKTPREREIAYDSRAKFMALPNCHSGDGHGTLNSIARTNGYGIHNLTDGDIQPANGNPFHYSAVCDIGSKLTHKFRIFFIRVFCDWRALIFQFIVASQMSSMVSRSPLLL